MSATTAILSFHGAGPSSADIKDAETRYKRADNDTPNLVNPIQIPTTGEAYGWRKHFKLSLTTAPVAQVSNLRWYIGPRPSETPDRNWDGVSIYAGVTASYAIGTSGDNTAKLPYLIDADTGVGRTDGGDPGPYDVDSPLIILPGVVVGDDETGVGMTQSFLVTQVGMSPLTVSGVKDPRDSFFTFDEI